MTLSENPFFEAGKRGKPRQRADVLFARRGRVRARGACIHRHGVARVDLAPLGLSFVFVSGDVVVRRHPFTSTESTESSSVGLERFGAVVALNHRDGRRLRPRRGRASTRVNARRRLRRFAEADAHRDACLMLGTRVKLC